jgi:hypothetical protein
MNFWKEGPTEHRQGANMRNRLLVISCLLAAAAAGCEEGERGYVAVQTGRGIVNGQIEEGFPSTVALGTEMGGPSAMCSGNLVTPRVIISAAHCGDGIPITLIQSMGVAFFGTDVTAAEAAIGFDNLVIHPDYVPLDSAAGELGQFDLSVFVLQEDAPAEPTWFRRDPIVDAELAGEVKSVGYGITGPDANDSGIKRSATLILADYDENFLISKNNYNPNEANICSGDSGGPQFFSRDGFWVQGAVHSWGDQDCAIESGSTRVDIAAEWILDQIEAVHGTRDVCEINGWYGDGLCHPFCDLPDPDCQSADVDAGPDAGPEDGGPLDDGGASVDANGGCGCAVVAGRASGAGSLLALVLFAGLALLRRRPRGRASAS